MRLSDSSTTAQQRDLLLYLFPPEPFVGSGELGLMWRVPSVGTVGLYAAASADGHPPVGLRGVVLVEGSARSTCMGQGFDWRWCDVLSRRHLIFTGSITTPNLLRLTEAGSQTHEPHSPP